jgi:hypothetical protein
MCDFTRFSSAGNLESGHFSDDFSLLPSRGAISKDAFAQNGPQGAISGGPEALGVADAFCVVLTDHFSGSRT